MARIWAHSEVEEAVRDEGFAVVAGMDEVGRGPLAGPMSVGVVILPAGFAEPVVDSKLLSPQQRMEKAIAIRAGALSFAVAHVEPEYIDTHGVTASLREAGRRALAQLKLSPDIILLDGRHNFLAADTPVRTLIKGDQISASIAAASILAKVERDDLMREYAHMYPEYGFETHVGYGTPRHIAALKKYGATPIHRQSFLTKIVA
jgi:ribonuclease HII